MQPLPLDDSRWANYRGCYRSPYNVVPLIQCLIREGTSKCFWQTVWDKLHHRGNIGEASYALVPYLVDFQSNQREVDAQLFHYCVTIELAQSERDNPPIPPEIEWSYALAMRRLPIVGTELLRHGCTEEVVLGLAAAMALVGGHRTLARAYVDFGRVDAVEYLSTLNGLAPLPFPHD